MKHDPPYQYSQTRVPTKKQKILRRRSVKHRDAALQAETRASETITVAWTVSVTGVVISDLVLVAAHLYARSHPSQPTRAFEAVILLSASAIGAVSLALLPAVWRLRRIKPPIGYTVFAVVVAIAPVAVLITRLVG